MSKALLVLRRAAVAVALCAAVVSLAGSSPAEARVWVGIGIPFYGPGWYPPPYYYPPPAYYPPPPPVYAPPPPQAYSQGPGPGGGQACYAGPYVCPINHPVATGAGCYCLGNGGQRVWGKAN